MPLKFAGSFCFLRRSIVEMNLFELFLGPLEKGGLDYMVTGSVAAMNYGEPRLTNDVDLILALTAESLHQLETAFPEDHFYRAPHEVLLAELARSQRGHTNIIHHDTGFRADIYFRAHDPLHVWAWPRRNRFEVHETLLAWFAPPEYVILRKLEYYQEGKSEKHLNDIRNILSQDAFDHLATSSDISDWAETLGLQNLWSQVRESAAE